MVPFSLDERSLPQPTLQLHRHRLHPPLPVHCCTNHRFGGHYDPFHDGIQGRNEKDLQAHHHLYLLTTICAAGIGLLLYLWIQPGNLPTEAIGAGVTNVPQNIGKMSYYDHMLSVIPNNILTPFLTGNVLSILLIATAVGLAFAFMPETENTKTLLRGINGAQEVLFALIRALLKVLPIGILAFAAQLSSQLEAGVIVGALGRYTLVIMAGNLTQFFIVLPLFLLIRGLNPVRVMKAMSPALAVALFTKSSAATLPVTMLLRKKTCASIPPSAVSFSPSAQPST